MKESLGSLCSIAAVSFLVGLALVPLVRAGARRFGFLDRPNRRSSHREVTPRGAGVAVLLATAAGFFGHPFSVSPAVAAVGAGTLFVAILGLLDDRFGVPAPLRLGCHAVAATGLVWVAGGLARLPLPAPFDLATGILGGPLAVLWIVGVVNIYNFLDGIDGLAGVQGIVAGIALAAADFDPLARLAGAAIAGACAAFVLFNWSPASIFLGDVGSGALGFLFASAPFLAPDAARPSAVLLMGLVLWFFLADAAWTLTRRVLRGERWYEAHRQHLYQRLVISGWSHGRVTLLIGLAAAVVASLAVSSYPSGPGSVWIAIGAALAAFALEAGIVRHREAKASS